MSTQARRQQRSEARLAWLVERAMTFAVTEDDDDAAVMRLAWLARGDHAGPDQSYHVCLSYTDVDRGIRGRAIGLLAACATATSHATRLPPADGGAPGSPPGAPTQ